MCLFALFSSYFICICHLTTAAAIDADAVNLPANADVTDAMAAEVAAASAEYDAESAYTSATANATG